MHQRAVSSSVSSSSCTAKVKGPRKLGGARDSPFGRPRADPGSSRLLTAVDRVPCVVAAALSPRATRSVRVGALDKMFGLFKVWAGELCGAAGKPTWCASRGDCCNNRVFISCVHVGQQQLCSRSRHANAPTSLAFQDTAPSWEELETLVRTQMQQHGVDFWADPNTGPTYALALKRTFGQPEAAVKLKLYRDHAGWCPYCQKVWLQLEEKRVPYIIEKINMRCYGDKPASFMSKVPGGLLPVIEYKGQVITESTVIMSIIEEEFGPEQGYKSLLPPKGTKERMRADALMSLERQFFSVWLGWLCNGWDNDGRRRKFEAVLEVVCRELDAAGGPFFLGQDISLVDITFTPMLERALASLAYYKGYFMRGQGKWPAIDRWFEAMEKRDTYLGTRSDYYTHCHDLPPQLGGCHMIADGEPIAAQIDGQDAASWHLPLPPLNAASLPEPYSPGEVPELDRLEAAAKLVGNRKALVRFALRGPGRPGPRPVSAPLADPSAVPAMEYEPAMDAAMRAVAHALLTGKDLAAAKQAIPTAVSNSSGETLHPVAPVVLGAEYLRDRVGVPRDFKLPAARQLRAHLNLLIDQLSTAA